MLRYHVIRALRRGFAAGCVILAGIGLSVPDAAWAGISRSCTGTIWINVDGDGNDLEYNFHIPVTVSSRVYANRARERSRDAMISCVQEHWNMRMSGGRPHWCDNGGDYPFNGFSEDMTDAICAANPNRQSFLVDVTLWVHGDTGCESHRMANDWGYYDIADNYRVYCWVAPQEEVREGWNLPRQDYRWFEMAAGARWQDCQAICNREDACRAWTYKHPAGGDPPLCFLKDGVPDWTRDDRFVSGIKGEVLH